METLLFAIRQHFLNLHFDLQYVLKIKTFIFVCPFSQAVSFGMEIQGMYVLIINSATSLINLLK
jgi:hypothetical protein